jgi:Rad3-related DNA helicase
MVAFRWEGLTKYQEEIEKEKRWQEKLDIEKKDQKLREKEFDLREKTLDFKILKQGQDLATEILKSLNINVFGSLSSNKDSGLGVSGGINLVDGKVDQSSNKIFMKKIQQAYKGISDETFTRLLESTNLQPNTMELLYNALTKTSAARIAKNRPVLSKEEIGTYFDNVVLTEGKPLENVIEILSKRFPNGMPDFLEQTLRPLTSLVLTSANLGVFEDLNPMADLTDQEKIKNIMFDTLDMRFSEYKNRITKGIDRLNKIDDKNKSRLDKSLQKYLENLAMNLSNIDKSQGVDRRNKLFRTFGTSDLLRKATKNLPGKDFPVSFMESPTLNRSPQYFPIIQNLNEDSGANNIQILKRLTDLGVLEYYNENNPDNFFSQWRQDGVSYPNYEKAN